MTEFRHLRNAPIAEAVIDFRVEATNFPLAAVRDLVADLSDIYPDSDELKMFIGGVDVSSGEVRQTSRDLGIRGVRALNKSQGCVAQFRADGFTFSKLKPYTKWELVLEEAVRLWNRYRGVVDIERVTRLAVRYINQFGVSEVRYSRIPKLIPGLPEGFTTKEVQSSLQRFVLQEASPGPKARVAVATQPESPGRVEVTIDADCFHEVDLPPNDDFRTEFEELREVKNRIFFGMLPEDVLKEFE